ncbi:hypothetical protein KOSB73_210268 [Klebsiella grimontii]|uniref:Uncharacterized protein n=1 Tax=Klebsiella grimontii TaxID=2058152 RepID=A0A285AYL3_9ENTR|nr:hypothetical protein KOSB73_210268 [Klebsiella grimontii]
MHHQQRGSFIIRTTILMRRRYPTRLDQPSPVQLHVESPFTSLCIRGTASNKSPASYALSLSGLTPKAETAGKMKRMWYKNVVQVSMFPTSESYLSGALS